MLKKVVIIVVCILTFSLGKSQNFFSSEDYDALVIEAKQTSQPYFVYFSASWCMPCRMMQETVFQDPMVISYVRDNYLAVKLNVDHFDAMLLAEKYDIGSIPAILFFDSNGNLTKKLMGLQTGTNFLEILKECDY